jgi:hypothetical protein
VTLHRARGRVNWRPCCGGRLKEAQDLIVADFVIKVIGGNIGGWGEVVLFEHCELPELARGMIIKIFIFPGVLRRDGGVPDPRGRVSVKVNDGGRGWDLQENCQNQGSGGCKVKNLVEVDLLWSWGKEGRRDRGSASHLGCCLLV